MLVLAGVPGDGVQERMERAVRSGEALDVFRRFVGSQGGDGRICDDYGLLPEIPHRIDISARTGGTLNDLDALAIGEAVAALGTIAPSDPASGVILHRKIGDAVKRGDRIMTVHASEIIDETIDRFRCAFTIGGEPLEKPKCVLARVDRSGVHEMER